MCISYRYQIYALYFHICKDILKKYLLDNTELRIVDCGVWFYAEYKADCNQRNKNKGAFAFRADMDAVAGKNGVTYQRERFPATENHIGSVEKMEQVASLNYYCKMKGYSIENIYNLEVILV